MKFTTVGMVTVRVCDQDGCETWEGVRIHADGSAACPEHRPADPAPSWEQWERRIR